MSDPSKPNSSASPGPWRWKAEITREGSNYVIRDMPTLVAADDTEVCHFGDSTQYYPSEGAAPDEANAALIASAPTMLTILRELEWSSWDEHGNFAQCPKCEASRAEGVHKSDCRLAALLDRLGRG